MPICLAIVDDHPLLLSGLRQSLEQAKDMQVVAACRDGEEALEAVRRFYPEVMLLDLVMPKKDGLCVLRELRDAHDSVKVIVLTGVVDDKKAVEAMILGARGLLPKHADVSILLQCIRRVAAGSTWIDNDMSARMVEKLVHDASTSSQAKDAELTPREHELVRLVASGLRNKEIAGRLSIHEGTVKAHLFHVYQKLGVTSRVELVLRARENGLT